MMKVLRYESQTILGRRHVRGVDYGTQAVVVAESEDKSVYLAWFRGASHWSGVGHSEYLAGHYALWIPTWLTAWKLRTGGQSDHYIDLTEAYLSPENHTGEVPKLTKTWVKKMCEKIRLDHPELDWPDIDYKRGTTTILTNPGQP